MPVPIPHSRDALYRQAMYLRGLQRFEEALVVLGRMQPLHPAYSRLYQERGHCHVGLQDIPNAIEAFAQAVKLNAALPESWQMLHTLYRQQGDEPQAARMAEHLASLRKLPHEIIAAADLFADGELSGAERLLRIYLAQRGEHLEALRLLGRICLARGWREEAGQLLEAVVQRAPGYRAARADFARALLDQHHYVRCREQLQQLLDLDPDNRGYLRQYGAACIRQGDLEPGVQLYRRLLADAQAGAETAELNLWIAHALRAMGQQAQALEGYRAALAALPQGGEAWFSLANLKTYTFGEEEMARMRALEAAPAAADIDRYHLCFALGKALEDQANYAEAWRFYVRGNALKRANLPYQPQLAEAHCRQSTQVCTGEFFASRAGWGVPDADPIFILGLPRAGSTLIEQILASHSQVEGTRELPDLQRTVRQLRGRGTDPDASRYPQVLADLGPEDVRRFGERYLADTRLYRKTARPFFIDKLPDNFRDIGLIELMLPNAKIIDARREPMACCIGNFKQLYAGGQEFSYAIEDVTRYYRTYLEIMRHWKHVLPGRILTVQYEALVEDLEGQVRGLLSHCGLAFEPACLSFHQTERSVHSASSEQVRQPLHKEGVAQWRNFEPWTAPFRDGLGDALTAYRD